MKLLLLLISLFVISEYCNARPSGSDLIGLTTDVLSPNSQNNGGSCDKPCDNDSGGSKSDDGKSNSNDGNSDGSKSNNDKSDNGKSNDGKTNDDNSGGSGASCDDKNSPSKGDDPSVSVGAVVGALLQL